jgi:glycosyltransferase involved in cell wall biosynthesis
MRVIVATSVVPFVEGGATQIVAWLVRKLKEHGHEVDTFELPFSEAYPELLDQLLAFRLLDMSEHGERMIAVRTPSHLLKHPNKVTWFIHHYRGAYDLWGTKYQTLPATPEGLACRQAIMNSDTRGLRECKQVFCNSTVVKDRLSKFNGIAAQVLYPPLLKPEQFRCDEYGDYLFYVARLAHHKRQWLAIEALRYTHTPVKLVIAGAPDPGFESYVFDLRHLINKYGLEDRVSMIPHWIPDADKIDLLAKCAAAVYFPFDEDSYGYPSLEAHAARKAVLTTIDAGATNELIRDDVNGLVTPADPELIAAAMDALYNNRLLCRRLGEAGEERIRELQIDWDHVISALLA